MARPNLATFVAGFISIYAIPAAAQDLTYAPTNPSFGGNPFNSAHLLGIAGGINNYKDPDAPATSNSQSDQFARQLQSRLLSALSGQITEAIFGENAQETGDVSFGGQQISWVRSLDGVTVTIVDEASGGETVIRVPTFIEVG